jgi:hypothetical protein
MKWPAVPRYAQLMADCELIAHLENLEAGPTDEDCAALARMFMRYSSNDTFVLEHLNALLDRWQMERDVLYARARALWSRGYRPQQLDQTDVGSSFDTEDKETN